MKITYYPKRLNRKHLLKLKNAPKWGFGVFDKCTIKTYTHIYFFLLLLSFSLRLFPVPLWVFPCDFSLSKQLFRPSCIVLKQKSFRLYGWVNSYRTSTFLKIVLFFQLSTLSNTSKVTLKTDCSAREEGVVVSCQVCR